MHKFSIGADPEIFLTKEDKLRSAIGIVGGSKENPRDLGDGIKVQEDNVAAEFNIPPADNFEDFDKYIQAGLDKIEGIANRQGYNIAIVASGHFSEEDLQHPNARAFGCNPEMDVYLRDFAMAPDANSTLRTGAGHIHIGIQLTEDEKELLVKTCDLLIGVPCVLIDNSDASVDRKLKYGSAGRYRDTSYGIEYRVPSNFWVADSKYRKWIYDQVATAVEYVKQGKTLTWQLEDDIVDAINQNDTVLAKKLTEEHEIQLC